MVVIQRREQSFFGVQSTNVSTRFRKCFSGGVATEQPLYY
jgi:hypothetical protein